MDTIMDKEFDKFKLHQQILLNQAYEHVFHKNKEQTQILRNYRDKHKNISVELTELRSKLEINCLVPLGKKAFIKGKLVHTNEILVSLGDGYFATYSVDEAILLCNRRIKRCDKMLDDLVKEQNLYEMRQIIPIAHNAFGNDKCKDIEEFWDEEKLDDWRSQHRKKEKEYRTKLKALKNQEPISIKSEEDLFKKLDELELQEELEDECIRLENQRKNFHGDLKEGEVYEESDFSSETDDGEEETENETTDEKRKENTKVEKINKTVRGDNTDQDLKKDEDIENNDVNYHKIETNKHKEQELVCNISNEIKIMDIDILPKEDLNPDLNSLQTISYNKVGVSNSFDKGDDKFKNYDDKSSQKPKAILPVEHNNSNVTSNRTVNGKFAVSIVKEDDIQKVVQEANLSDKISVVHKSPIFNPYKCKRKSYIPDSNDTMIDNSVDKIKGSGRRVSFAPSHEDEFDIYNKKVIFDQKEVHTIEEQEDGNEDSIRINFKHTENNPIIHDREQNCIHSPKDIYRIYCKPKSILKRSQDDLHVYESAFNISDYGECYAQDNTEFSAYTAVVKDIKERETTTNKQIDDQSVKQPRPVSKFKLERSKKKK